MATVTYKSYAKTAVKHMRDRTLAVMADKAKEYFLDPSLELVPLDEGDLQNSGKVSIVGSNVFVSYDTHYAIDQHENLYYRHLPGRQAKYLEQPFRQNAEIFIKEVMRNI